MFVARGWLSVAGPELSRVTFGLAVPSVKPLAFAALLAVSLLAQPAAPRFELVQPELFGVTGGQPNAWADFDNDGDLDEFVGFRGRPNRLYRQDHGRFEDVAAAVGLADNVETRAAAWGDFDADGHLDLYVGFIDGTPNKLYRNDGNGRHFTDVAAALGVALSGVTRQASWIDYDNDGDLDLFVAFRDKAEPAVPQRRRPLRRRHRRVGHRRSRARPSAPSGSTSTATAISICSSRTRTATPTACFGTTAAASSTSRANGASRRRGVPWNSAASAPAVADFDGDGYFDLFVANYGPSALYRNDRGRRFVDVTKTAGLFFEQHATTPSWGDYDNDGRPDLYVAGFLVNVTHYPDHLFHNAGTSVGRARFEDVLPALVNEHDGSHGVQWVDFDGDGALDLALTNNDPAGGHYLFRNLLPPARRAAVAFGRRRRRARPSHQAGRRSARLRRRERDG